MCTDGNMESDRSTNRRSRGEEEKSRKAERSLALEPGLAGSSLAYPRGAWFYSSFSMPRSMISAKLTGRPSLSVALSESERIFS